MTSISFTIKPPQLNRKFADAITEFSETTLRVRYAETDQMGVVYHGSYFAWLEVGRVEWCRQHGLL